MMVITQKYFLLFLLNINSRMEDSDNFSLLLRELYLKVMD